MKCKEQEFYSGGYYLFRVNTRKSSSTKGARILTCSECVNDSLLDAWAIPWVNYDGDEIQETIDSLEISTQTHDKIRNWVDDQMNKGNIGSPQVFSDLQTVKYYRDTYFKHIKDKEILQILFSAEERKSFLNEFKPVKDEYGTLGIYDNLLKKIPEMSDSSYSVIGYDLIGVEISGGFHTFHCHDLASELNTKFNVKVNDLGLISKIPNRKEIAEYMNNEDSGFEPVPWFWVKVIRIMDI